MIHDLQAAGRVPAGLGMAPMIAIPLLAAHVPARRAARVDPAQSWRYE